MHTLAPLLSISLLSSGRPESLWKCLDSLKAILEEIPGELVIVDTGCDEETRKKMGEYTDRIVSFSWCNDFAAARNAGLSACTGEWFMYIDDDEWFENRPSELIEFFLSGEYRSYDQAGYRVKNYVTKTGKEASFAWVGRLCKLDENTRFHGAIHEYLAPIGPRLKLIRDHVEHYGYAFDTEEERERHAERNRTLLWQVINREPGELRWREQLIADLNDGDHQEELLDLCEKTLQRIAAGDAGRGEVGETESFLVGRIFALIDEGKIAEARQQSLRALNSDGFSERARAAVCQKMASYDYDHEEYTRAFEEAREYLDLCPDEEDADALTRKPILFGIFDVRVRNLMRFVSLCAGIRIGAERDDTCFEENGKVRTDLIRFEESSEENRLYMIREMLRLAAGEQEVRCFDDLIRYLAERRDLVSDLVYCLQDLASASEDPVYVGKDGILLDILSEVQAMHPYIGYLHLYRLFGRDDEISAEKINALIPEERRQLVEDVKYVFANVADLFTAAPWMVESVRTLEMDGSEALACIPENQWEYRLYALMDCGKEEVIDSWNELVQEKVKPEDKRCRHFGLGYMEFLLGKHGRELSREELKTQLLLYVREVLQFCNSFYALEMEEGKLAELPASGRFATLLSGLFMDSAAPDQTKQEALLTSCKRTLPIMADALDYCFEEVR